MAWSARLLSNLLKRKNRKSRRTILNIQSLESRAVPAVSGLVFNDQNGNGIREAADVGIANVAVSLFAGDTLIDSSTTDTNGAYLFSDVQPDTAYQVRIDTAQSALTGLILVAANQGGDDAVDSDAVVTAGNATVDFTTDTSASDVAFDAGFTAPASIAGQVFLDYNNSGTFNGPDTGIAGVTMSLSGGSLTTPLTVETDASGNFVVPDLLPGTYVLTQTQPTTPANQSGINTAGTAGGTPQTDNVIDGIILNAGQSATGYTFAEVPLLSTGGTVFNDLDGNGQFDTGEPGISGVTITLTGTDVVNGVITPQTAVTNSSGAYTFADLLPGTYSLAETQPSGFTDGQDQNGTPAATTVGNDVFTGIDLTSTSAVSGGFNFGETSTAGTGSISGTVFRDADADGVMDAGETGISGVQLTLTGTDNLNQPVSLSATTSSTGAFTFSNLRPGTYTIVETQPTGWTDGKDTAGLAGGDATAVNDQISGIVLTAGQSATGYLFAEQSGVDLTLTQHLGSTSAQPGSTFVITYTLKNEGQVAALDVDVDIDIDDLEFVSANSTDFDEATGIWSAGDVAAGAAESLEITVRVPDFGSFSPTAVVTQVANGILTNNDVEGTVAGASPSFWYLSSGWDPLFNVAIVTSGSSVVDATTPSTAPPSLTLGNLVFRDNNNNGQSDAGEPGVTGVVLELLDGSGNPISGGTATTDANGAYSFAGLAAGDYRVRLAASNFQTGGALAGFTSSSTTAADPDDNINNNNDGQISGVLGSGGFIQSGAITLALTTEPTNDGDTNNNTNLTLDFGVVQIAADTLTLGDRVFRDADGNGLFEGAETGVANVSVQLLNSTGTVIQTVTTDSTGLYAFSNLTAGDYRVRLAASNFNAGSALAGFSESATSVADPDNDVDNDNNGAASGTLGSGGFIESELITLAVGSEPGADGNTNLTLDFGAVPPPPPEMPTLELNAASDTGTQGDDTTDLATVTLVGTTTANVAVKLVETGATTTSDSSGAFNFVGVPVTLGGNAFTVEASNGGGTTSFTTTITRNAPPTVVDPLDPVPLAVSGTTIIDVAGTFDDADITNTRIAFNTSEGTINVELFDRQAPKTVANFLNYVNDGDYADSIFHRSAELDGGIPFVLQGGGFAFESTPTPSLVDVPSDPSVENEPDAVNRSNILGTLAMAKLPNLPDSATNQFFFNLGDNSAILDGQNGGFTVFGKVVDSADQAVVDALAAIPTQNQGAAPNLPPSQLGTFTDIPLTDYTGTEFPTDTTADNYALINGISIVSQTEVLTYSVVNNSDPTVATAVMADNRITITALQAGQTTLTIRATDQSGSTVETTVTVTVG